MGEECCTCDCKRFEEEQEWRLLKACQVLPGCSFCNLSEHRGKKLVAEYLSAGYTIPVEKRCRWAL